MSSSSETSSAETSAGITSTPVGPPAERGVCIWLTGPSGAGKSTVTRELLPLLHAAGRTVSVLDVVPVLRKLPCEWTSEGKLLRKAFVAGEVARHGGIAVCVTVSARRTVRGRARELVGADRFLEILVEAPQEVARARKDARGRRPPLTQRLKRLLTPLAARVAYRGRDSYERPVHADLHIDTSSQTPTEGASAILDLLVVRGFVAPARGEASD